MNQLVTLVRAQFLNNWQGRNKKGKGAVPLITTAAVFLYISLLYSGMFYSLLTGQEYYAACLLGGISFFGLLISGLSWAGGMLIKFRDFDLLMSLPVSQEKVIFSKLLSFLSMLWIYSGEFILPAMILFGIRTGASFLFYAFMVVGWIGLPVMPALISILIGLGIRRLSIGMKHEKVWRFLWTLFFTVAMITFVNFLNSDQGAQGLLTAGIVAEKLFPLTALYMRGLSMGKYGYVMLELGIEAGVFLAALRPLAKVALQSSMQGEVTFHDANFHVKKERSHSPLKALIRRENIRSFSNSMYMINMLMGTMLVVAAALVSLFSPQALMKFFAIDVVQLERYLGLLTVALAGMIGLSANPCAVSISLEGRNIDLLKSMPIHVRSLFWAKILSQLELLALPVAVSVCILLIRFRQPAGVVALGTLVIVLEGVFDAAFGLLINLHYPKLDWDRDVIVYKRSLSAFLGPLCGITLNLALLMISFSMPAHPYWVMAVIALLLGVLDLVLLRILTTKGIRRFGSIA